MEKVEVSSLQNWRSFAKLKEHIFCFLPRMKKLFLIKCLWMKLQLYWRSQFGLRDSSKGISGDAAIFKYRGWIKLQACSKNTKMLGQQVPLRGRVITTMCNTPSLCLSSIQESEHTPTPWSSSIWYQVPLRGRDWRRSPGLERTRAGRERRGSNNTWNLRTVKVHQRPKWKQICQIF